MKILGIDNNAKTVKGRKKQYSTAIIYLAPSNASGVINTCTSASRGCRAACLFTSGRGRMNPIREARINKTKFLVNEEEKFLRQLWKETSNHIKLSNKKGLIPCERLNGTSDLRWEDYKLEGQNIFESFKDLKSISITGLVISPGLYINPSIFLLTIAILYFALEYSIIYLLTLSNSF